MNGRKTGAGGHGRRWAGTLLVVVLTGVVVVAPAVTGTEVAIAQSPPSSPHLGPHSARETTGGIRAQRSGPEFGSGTEFGKARTRFGAWWHALARWWREWREARRPQRRFAEAIRVLNEAKELNKGSADVFVGEPWWWGGLDWGRWLLVSTDDAGKVSITRKKGPFGGSTDRVVAEGLDPDEMSKELARWFSLTGKVVWVESQNERFAAVTRELDQENTVKLLVTEIPAGNKNNRPGRWLIIRDGEKVRIGQISPPDSPGSAVTWVKKDLPISAVTRTLAHLFKVSSKITVKKPGVQYFYPRAVTENNLPYGLNFNGDDFKILMLRDRQIRYPDEALDVFADLDKKENRDSSLTSLAEKYFPGQEVEEITLTDLRDVLLRDAGDDRPIIWGILDAGDGYTVETRDKKLVFYSAEGDVVSFDQLLRRLAENHRERVSFLPTDRGRRPVSPRLGGDLPERRKGWHPVTHGDAFLQAAETLQSAAEASRQSAAEASRSAAASPRGKKIAIKIEIMGTLIDDVDRQSQSGIPLVALGQLHSRGTRVKRTLELLPSASPDGEPRVGVTTQWNLTDYANMYRSARASDWIKGDTKVITLSQLTEEAGALPTGNTYLRVVPVEPAAESSQRNKGNGIKWPWNEKIRRQMAELSSIDDD